MTEPDNQFGEALLSGGSQGGKVLSPRALEQTDWQVSANFVEWSSAEPYRRLRVYEYEDRDF